MTDEKKCLKDDWDDGRVVKNHAQSMSPKKKVCRWAICQNEHLFGLGWHGACKKEAIQYFGESGPIGYGFKFCPFCGAELVEEQEAK